MEFVNKTVSGLGDNQFFGAGFGLAALGLGVTLSRQALALGVLMFKRHRMVRLEVTHKDQSYPYILNWLKHNQKTLNLSLVTQLHRRPSGQITVQSIKVPGPGTHFFRFSNKWIKVDRERQQSSIDITTGLPFETIRFTCLGTNSEVFDRLIAEAESLERVKHDGRMTIFSPRTDGWEPDGEPEDRRHYDTVILDDNVAEGICSDVQKFLAKREWYKKRGVPYRRGYLLHGPPGCGKTSYIMALAGKLEYDICDLDLSNSALSNERLSFLLKRKPEKSFILLEDIDAAFMSRDHLDLNKTAYQGLGSLTMSGLLNILDGSKASQDRIIFMTTNYPERLDPALKRAGRIDVQAYIGYASDSQLSRAFERFYPNGPKGIEFVKALGSPRPELSMADVQAYFLLHEDDPKEVLKNVNVLLSSVNKMNK